MPYDMRKSQATEHLYFPFFQGRKLCLKDGVKSVSIGLQMCVVFPDSLWRVSRIYSTGMDSSGCPVSLRLVRHACRVCQDDIPL